MTVGDTLTMSLLLHCFYETCCAYFIAIICCIFTCGNSPIYTKLRRKAKRGPCPIIKPIEYPLDIQEAVDLIADITNIEKKCNIYRDNLYLIFIEIGNRFPMDIIDIILLFSQFSQRVITRKYSSKISDRIYQEMPLRIAILGVDHVFKVDKFDSKSITDYLREHTLKKLNYDGIDFYFNQKITSLNANIIQNVFDYHIIILIFDLNDITTLNWMYNNRGIDLRQFNETAMILCGIHCDIKPMNNNQQIDEKIKKIMDFYNCPYIEISSKYNVNINKLLEISVREYNEHYCQYLWRKDGQIWPDCIVL